jgi:co-chaperonin GroES (HSP10)
MSTATTEKLTTLRMLHDRILVRLFKKDEIANFPTLAKLGVVAPEIAGEKVEKASGSIIFMEDAGHRGEVLAVGPGKLVPVKCRKCGDKDFVLKPMTVKVGDVVWLGRYVDFHEDEGLVIAVEDDVRGVEE